ncbi:unnamed protein product [Mycena citricolor]|uniref:ABC transporter domain-containing protein n=1 Tax=Mycena citricolor TaxID=2018698 RepID=A0AAD2Q7H4_9AGAR|nr:unnamed protein product [Mycena citricolor]
MDQLRPQQAACIRPPQMNPKMPVSDRDLLSPANWGVFFPGLFQAAPWIWGVTGTSGACGRTSYPARAKVEAMRAISSPLWKRASRIRVDSGVCSAPDAMLSSKPRDDRVVVSIWPTGPGNTYIKTARGTSSVFSSDWLASLRGQERVPYHITSPLPSPALAKFAMGLGIRNEKSSGDLDLDLNRFLPPELYTSLKLGVWRLVMEKDAGDASSLLHLPGINKIRDVIAAIPMLVRFFLEIYALCPHLMLVYILLRVWGGLETVVMLYSSTRVLQSIELGLRTGKPDLRAIGTAVALRVAGVTLSAVMKWARDCILPVLKSKVDIHFEDTLLQASLRRDLPTSLANEHKGEPDAENGWRAYETLLYSSQRILRLVIQLLFISSQECGGIAFSIAILASPIASFLTTRNLVLKPHIVFSDNEDYIRMRALKSMAALPFREQIISENLVDWIWGEYKKARNILGSAAAEDVYHLHDRRPTPIANISREWAGELPTLFWAFSAVMQPRSVSMTSIAIMQQYATSLSYSLELLMYDLRQIGKALRDIAALYEAADVRNELVDGELAYPGAERHSSEGMDVEFRNVTFAYAGTKSIRPALVDVSFRIPAGSLAVIVGTNGSGKSTAVKLLTRLFDPVSGTILVDGTPVQKYRLSDLREAHATLMQTYRMYPLSIADNIGLGRVETMDDEDAVIDAARNGCAVDVLSKFKHGLHTTLEPPSTSHGYQINHDSHSGLGSYLTNLEKTVDVSGGERQRLVASRIFMRLRSEKIKLVAVDEPSSALDAKCEYDLFKHLRRAGRGKTIVCVTHRFGHLTRNADVVICMKDGRVVETGTHDQLMARDGEYASLYRVQAQAFAGTESPSP